MTYDEFFAKVVVEGASAGQPAGIALHAYAYQRYLAEQPWPDMLHIPTGLGKTAAITAAWLYRRMTGDESTPRRLIWCLPMRVLVEQTRDSVQTWIEHSAPLFAERGMTAPRVFVLMGGEADGDWVRQPEHPAVIIGTQDMLLSRALMRGYGMIRYRWPVDFALLHNDAFWVFDEVQLMGAGLPTSAQLEGFRRSPEMSQMLPARTLWSSATLNTEWFDTVDFRPHLPDCRISSLPPEDRADPRVLKRLSAAKQLTESAARLASARKPDVKAYIEALCDDVLAAHSGDAPSLVILNRVGRAQDVYRRMRQRLVATSRTTRLLLVHARFRAAERAVLNVRLRELRFDDDVIVIATQAVEAGVDITSRHLFTELAPWSSLVQRFGRCNRGGEYDDAVVHWMDIDSSDAQLALPYVAGSLDEARAVLRTLGSAASSQLPPVVETHATMHVLRKKDLLELFNTEPDLSGFDIDISPYLRDSGGADVHVFWRAFDKPDAESRPHRSELCAVPIGAAREHLRALKRRAWSWDSLARKWERVEPGDMRPGQILLLQVSAGGYDAEVGFVSGLRDDVQPIAVPLTMRSPESMEDDEDAAGPFVELSEHLLAAKREAVALTETLPMAGAADAVVQAALWHDVGKSHAAFQTAILEHAPEDVDRSRLYAKSPNARRMLKYGIMVDGVLQSRRYFRHELASALAWFDAGRDVDVDTDLVAYLIAAHHGKVRMALRSLPKETAPSDDRLFARGVWEGDVLAGLSVNGLTIPPVTLQLDVMRLGVGAMGASWSTRTAALLERWGPFRLAWLETMVRLADWRGSTHVVVRADIQDIVRMYSERLRRDLGDDIAAVLLYGSHARGDADEDADINVLVVVKKRSDYGELLERTSASTSEVSLRHEVVISRVFTTLEDYQSTHTPFFVNVRREAVSI